MGLASTRRVSMSSTRPSGSRRSLVTSYSMQPGSTMKEVLASTVVAALLAAPVAGQSKASGKMHARQVFVTVTDRAGAPILDLMQDDFEITEDGVSRRITRAGLATDPLRIVLLVDTSDTTAPALNQIRAGLQEFFAALPP